MCAWGKTIRLQIGDAEHDIDWCIAPIVAALNRGGVQTAMSCCGHGAADGFILLGDGRVLAVLPREAFKERGFQETAERFDNFRLDAGR